MSKKILRVNIPRNADDILKLAKDILAKHSADGTSSKLNAMEDFNWAANGPKVAPALALQVQVKQLEKQVENLYKQRDLLLTPIQETVKASRDMLIGAFKSNPKKLGEWGFVVDDTPRAKTSKIVA